MKKVSFEILRKLFHLLCLIFPLIYFYLNNKSLMVCLLLPLTIIFTLMDYYRRKNTTLKKLFSYFHHLMRASESRMNPEFTGTTFMLWGMLVTTFFFPKEIAIESWIVLAFADSTAALVGKQFKSEGKSLLGALSFFCMALVCVGAYHHWVLGLPMHWVSGIAVCAITTLAEYYARQIYLDDNFLIPVAFCCAATFVPI